MLTVRLNNSKRCGLVHRILLIDTRSRRLCRAWDSAGARELGTGQGENRMFPVIHVVFAALGALLGAGVAPRGEWRFAVLVGACIGYAVAELSSVRGRLLLLEADIAKLRASLRRRDVETPAPSQSPQQAPAEMPAQAPAEMPAPAPAARASAPPPASVSAPVTASAP